MKKSLAKLANFADKNTVAYFAIVIGGSLPIAGIIVIGSIIFGVL